MVYVVDCCLCSGGLVGEEKVDVGLLFLSIMLRKENRCVAFF